MNELSKAPTEQLSGVGWRDLHTLTSDSCEVPDSIW